MNNQTYWDPTSGGFYSSVVHGSRRITIDDPAWTRPTIEVNDPTWTRPTVETVVDGETVTEPDASAVAPQITAPDYSAVAPTIEVDNPACTIPATAIEITEAEHTALVSAVNASARATITLVDGRPTVVEAPVTLTEAQGARVATLRAACRATIIGGVTVSALGAPYTYPTDDTAQVNLGGLVTRSMLAPTGWTCTFATADAAGVWAYRVHTVAEIQAVGIAVSDHIAAAMSRFDTLRTTVETATDIASVNAVTWEA